MCKSNEEMHDHWFIYCDCVRWLWNSILASKHMDWVLSRRIENMLQAYRGHVAGVEEKTS